MLDIEFEWDLSGVLGDTLGDCNTKNKNTFKGSGIFPGKVDSVILLGFDVL